MGVLCRDCRHLNIMPALENCIASPNDPFKFFGGSFNVVISTDETTMTINGATYKSMREVFCIACGSRLGLYYESAVSVMYNEGNFYINRFKLHGPPEGSDDDENPGNEEQVV
ncbi:unnamed protein product [Arabis nemorensis]|uniref:Yippee domain-containing protein n=1 Tax=Arabis nemorensis TaxID=586526 RepID=A0A565CSL3_9BRAS|nr:unnamed protein product [Arabis nemorensis]